MNQHRVADSIVDAVGETPLIRLHRVVPDHGVELFGKGEARNPAGSVKDRVGLSMIRAAEITGAGDRAFCSGADLKFVIESFENLVQRVLQKYIRTLANDLHTKVVLEFQRLGKPVVASINGVAAGAGFSLMLLSLIQI